MDSKKNKAGTITPTDTSILKTLKDIKADGLSSSHQHIQPSLIKQIQTAGINHHVWTVNEPSIATRFQQWGTGSITTDKPLLIKNALKAVPTP